jgi:hypothetical protein
MKKKFIQYNDAEIEYDETKFFVNHDSYLALVYFRKISFLEKFEFGLRDFLNSKEKLF